MSAKMSAARRAAFLKALRETGNQTIAAERAKVSRSWVQLQRSIDPQFKAEVAAAVAEAKARLGGAGGNKAPSGWGTLDGEELVVRGTNGRRVQIARARLRQWTPRVEDRFLVTLSATCNVKASCAEAGMSLPSAYLHRRRWRAFARRWDEAVETGYARVEIALVEHGGNLFSTPELPPEAPMPPMTVAQAIHILHMHKHEVRGIGKAPGKSWRPPPSLNDPQIRASILRIFEALERGDAVSEADKKRSEREWARRRG